MPTYDYQCGACGHHFEQFQSMTAKTLRKCPECGKSKLERLIGIGAGVIFKGSGFYQTDYRSDSYKQSEKQDAPQSDTKKTDAPAPKSKSDTKKTDAPAASSCTPACGTDSAPTGCQKKKSK